MVFVLHESGDASASWLVEGLRNRGLTVDAVSAFDLGTADTWRHGIDATGTTVEIALRDGRRFDGAEPRAIVNRLNFIPLETLRATAGADLGYAVQEMFALYLSWLNAWPATVINRPTPQGLSGNHRHPSVWATLAAKAELPACAWRQGDGDPPDHAWAWKLAEATAFVVGEAVVLADVLPQDLADGCRALCRLADLSLIGIDFARDASGQWEMTGASPTPNVMLGGEPLISALADALA